MSLIPAQFRYYCETGVRTILFAQTENGRLIEKEVLFPAGRTTLCFQGSYYNQLCQEITLPDDVEKVVEFYYSSGVNNDVYIVKLKNGRFALAYTINNRGEPIFDLNQKKFNFASYDNNSVVKTPIFEEAFLKDCNQEPIIFYDVKSGFFQHPIGTIVCSSYRHFSIPDSSFILNMPREEAICTFNGVNAPPIDEHPKHIFGNYLLRGEFTISSDGSTMFAKAEVPGAAEPLVDVATDFEFLNLVRYSNERWTYPCWYMV